MEKISKKRNNRFDSIVAMIFVMIAWGLFFVVQGPLEIIYFNSQSIPVDVKQMVMCCFGICAICVVAVSIVLNYSSIKVYRSISSFVLFITLGGYIQNTFLNSALKSASGSTEKFSCYLIVGNILIWWIIGMALLICHIKLSDSAWDRAKVYVAISLAFVFSVCIWSVTVDTGNSNRSELYSDYFSTKEMFELSSISNNAVIFIVDSFDNRIMDEILGENDELLEGYNDFTYYDNCVSTYSRTYPSVIHMLTGEYCFFDEEPHIWANQAYEKSDFWSELTKNECNVFLCTDKSYVGERGREISTNYVSRCLYSVDKIKCFGKLFKMTLYRNSPYALKGLFRYDMNMFGDEVLNYEDGYDSPISFFNDEWFEAMLAKRTVTSVEKEQRYLKVYHMVSVHKDFTKKGGIYSLQIIGEYLEQMKKQSVYDNTAVFIVADHGYSDPRSYDITGGNSPVLFVKAIGERHKEMIIKSAPVSHVDLLPSIADSLGIGRKDGTKSIWQVSENEERVREYYKTVFFNDTDGEIELKKYKVIGNAKEKESYILTGDRWDIVYSENNVFNE